MMSSLAKYEKQLHHLVSESWDEEANLIFRGQADREWPLESSADRRLRKVTPRDVIEYVIERLLHPARDEGYGHHAGKPLSDLELLATLQHHGAATCLIDFTSNFHIALWFACQDHQLDGSVFVVNRGDADSFQTITGERTGLEIAKILEDDGAVDSPDDSVSALNGPRIFCWTPPPSETRFVVQHGCFVFSRHRIPVKMYKTINVSSADKRDLLRSLRLYYGLEEKTVFRDFTGFAQSHGVEGVAIDTRTATKWFMMGRDYFQRRQYGMAIEYYDRAIDLMDPPSSEYYEQRGITYWVEKRYALAINDFSAAIELDSNNHVYFGWRGKAYRTNRQYEESIQDFDKAIALSPTNLPYYHSRGNAKRSLRRYEEAMDDYRKMTEVEESARNTSLFAQAMVRKDWGEATSDRSQFEAAVRDLDEALTIESGTKHNVYYHRGLIRKTLGRREGAIEDLKAAREAVKAEVNTIWKPRSRDAFLEKIERELREMGN